MSVNLLDLCVKDCTYQTALSALEKLGNATGGPLRVTMTETGPSIGVRSWTQFFDEFFLGDLDVKEQEDQTKAVLRTYVSRIENQIFNGIPSCATPRTQRMKQAIHKLQAKIKGEEVGPRTGSLLGVISARTMPQYRNGEAQLKSIKSFRGKFLVPIGLSMAPIPIEKVIADCRVGHDIGRLKNKYGESNAIEDPTDSNSTSEDDYYCFYSKIFNDVSLKNKSVAIRLLPSSNRDVYNENQKAAWRAAKEFLTSRKNQKKPVSVLICLYEVSVLKVAKMETQDALGPFGARDVLRYESDSEHKNDRVPSCSIL